jgi:hypothetical protein
MCVSLWTHLTLLDPKTIREIKGSDLYVVIRIQRIFGDVSQNSRGLTTLYHPPCITNIPFHFVWDGQPSGEPTEDEDEDTYHMKETKGGWTNNNAWVWLNSVCGLPVRVHTGGSNPPCLPTCKPCEQRFQTEPHRRKKAAKTTILCRCLGYNWLHNISEDSASNVDSSHDDLSPLHITYYKHEISLRNQFTVHNHPIR